MAWIATLASTSGVRAQESAGAAEEPAGDDEQARRHFRLGSAHFENGEFLAAAREFEEALALSHRPELYYNIYLAYRDALDIRRAHAALRDYLSSVEHPPHDRAFLESRLTAMETAIAAMPPETAPTPPTEATATGPVEPELAAEPDVASPPERRTVPGDFWDRGPAPYAVLGGGLAIVVLGGVLAGLSADAASRLDALCPGGACPSGSGWEGIQSDGRGYAIGADTAFGVGAATVAAAVVVFFVVEPPSREVVEGAAPPSVSLGCGPRGCGLYF